MEIHLEILLEIHLEILLEIHLEILLEIHLEIHLEILLEMHLEILLEPNNLQNDTQCHLQDLAVSYFSHQRLFYNYWPFGEFLCKFNGFFKYANMFCSVFLLAVISIDRALCIWHPIITKNRRTLCAARLVSGVVWLAAVILSAPYFVYRQVFPDDFNLSKCSMDVKGYTESDKVALFSIRFLCGFLLPFLIILSCYILAGLGIKRTRLSGKTRPLRILALLVCTFFLCWAPYHCFLLAKMVNKKTKVVRVGVNISKGFAYLNSCINPLLYFCMGLNVRGSRFGRSIIGVYQRALAEDEDGRNTQSIRRIEDCDTSGSASQSSMLTGHTHLNISRM
ncbi:hypothetical protein DPEC_G00200470 [Dallia pectoralis]|uniref:Uncharacterized protein n=1 Tax=Dallia pectoralis TaxID=75939 RepID=A0ACC2G8R5_DALPE|nr:hypothetical protein DPEC_G00200470 [Dallia pectoralis]